MSTTGDALGVAHWTAALISDGQDFDLGRTTGTCTWELSSTSSARIDVDLRECQTDFTAIGDDPADLELELRRDELPIWRGDVNGLSQDPQSFTLSIDANDWTNQAAGYPIEQDVVAPGIRRPGRPLETPAWDAAAFLSAVFGATTISADAYRLERSYNVPVTAAIQADSGLDLARVLTSVADLLNWTVIDGVLVARPVVTSIDPTVYEFSIPSAWFKNLPSVRRTAGRVTRVVARSSVPGTSRNSVRATAVDSAAELRRGKSIIRVVRSSFTDLGTLQDVANRTLLSLASGLEIGSVQLLPEAQVEPYQLEPGALGEISTGTTPLAYEGPVTISQTTWQWKNGVESYDERPSVTFSHPSVTKRTRNESDRQLGSIAADHERRLRAVEEASVSPSQVSDQSEAMSQLLTRLAPLGIFDV